ncbi:MAG TPA: hypothetical protein VE129_16720 [Thermoanaerobaculia bacterium]|nr:hypothetical protein [Thermoanaerobaculia bacterium]
MRFEEGNPVAPGDVSALLGSFVSRKVELVLVTSTPALEHRSFAIVMRAPRGTFLAIAVLLAPVVSAEEPSLDLFFVRLLKQARLGTSPIEHAAWLVRAPDGSSQLVPWPPSGLTRSHMWSGPRPANTVALLHTHPVGCESEPSVRDRATAQRLGLPVYAITRQAVYLAEADGTVSLVASPYWTPAIDWARANRADDPVRSPGKALVAASPSGGALPEEQAAFR